MIARLLLAATVVVAVPSAPAPARAAPDPAAIVRAVDEVRMPDGDNLLIAFSLQASQSGRTESAYSYRLRNRKGSGSLVDAVDGDQRGQRYLSTPAGYWLFTPRTRQALRLTPLQLIRGQASIGDISRMRFSSDYHAAMAAQPMQTVSGIDCWAIELRATSPQATYAAVTLYVARADGRPVRADLASAAGRRLKTVRFGAIATVSGRSLVQNTIFEDAIDTRKTTVMRLQRVEQAKTPAVMFKPQALGIE
jgi:hypothetical protein